MMIPPQLTPLLIEKGIELRIKSNFNVVLEVLGVSFFSLPFKCINTALVSTSEQLTFARSPVFAIMSCHSKIALHT